MSYWPHVVADTLAAALLVDVEEVRRQVGKLAPQELGRLQHAAELIVRECGKRRWSDR